MLHTHLLLEKALVNRLRSATTPALIQHAQLLLAYTLAFSSKRDFFNVFQLDIIYLVSVKPGFGNDILTCNRLHFTESQPQVFTL